MTIRELQNIYLRWKYILYRKKGLIIMFKRIRSIFYKTMDEKCSGCSAYEIMKSYPSEYNTCSRYYKPNKRDCPCMNCLIKGICTNACEKLEYKHWRVWESYLYKRKG